MNCQCCGHQKSTLRGVDSELAPGVALVLCESCRSEGHQPRWLVALSAKSGRDVRKYITEKNYCGKILHASEIV